MFLALIAGCVGDMECGFQMDVRLPTPMLSATFSYWFRFSSSYSWTRCAPPVFAYIHKLWHVLNAAHAQFINPKPRLQRCVSAMQWRQAARHLR